MAPSPRFWNWMAKRYARQPIADEAAYRKKLEISQGYLRPDMAVLEFGCGTGSTALEHAAHVACIDAIDYSEKMIGIARGKAADRKIANVPFSVATIEDWQAPDHGYDVVFGLSILHLLDDREAVLRKVHRLLKPGGVFISSTACLSGMGRFALTAISALSALRLLPVVRVFSEAELVANLRDAGFEVDHKWRPDAKSAVFIVAKAV